MIKPSSKRSGIHDRRRAPRSRQTGVSAIVVGIIMLVLVPVLALALDVGQLYYAQRDLQRLATVASLDASRVESGCYLGGDGTPGSLSAAQAAVAAALAANGVTTGGPTPSPITSTVDFGKFDNSTTPGTRVFTVLDDKAAGVDAVRVTLQRPMPPLLVGFLTPTPAGGILQASASAQHAATASYMIGTTLLNIDSTRATLLNNIYGPIIGAPPGALNINAVGYQGLANANVTVEALAASLGLNLVTPGKLLGTKLPLPDFINALANAAAASGQAAAASTLDTIAAFADPNRKTSLGDVLGLESGAEQLIGALPINTLDLLNALALSASKGFYPIKLPSLGLNLGGVQVDTYLTVLNPLQPSGGLGLGRPGLVQGTPRTYANTSQIALLLRASVVVPGLATVRLGTDVNTASATSYLKGIRCPTGTGASQSTQPTAFINATPSLANLTVGSFPPANPTGPLTGGSLVGVGSPVLGLDISLPSGPIGPQSLGGGAESTLSFQGPYPQTQTVGSKQDIGGAAASLVSGLNLKVCATVLGAPICVLNTTDPNSLPLVQRLILAPVLAALNPAIASLGKALNTTLQGVFDGLGIEVGSATIIMEKDAVAYGNGSRGVTPGSVPSLFTEQKPGLAAAPATR
ncbi:MAG: TadG family pilus assembly protein [Nevskia sp.]